MCSLLYQKLPLRYCAAFIIALGPYPIEQLSAGYNQCGTSDIQHKSHFKM